MRASSEDHEAGRGGTEAAPTSLVCLVFNGGLVRRGWGGGGGGGEGRGGSVVACLTVICTIEGREVGRITCCTHALHGSPFTVLTAHPCNVSAPKKTSAHQCLGSLCLCSTAAVYRLSSFFHTIYTYIRYSPQYCFSLASLWRCIALSFSFSSVSCGGGGVGGSVRMRCGVGGQ